MTELSADRLKHLVNYNPVTGIFTWNNPGNPRMKSGDVVGHLNESNGYYCLTLDGIRYQAHQVAWFYMYGEWTRVDHRDTAKGNNAISNLRKATNSQNAANRGVYMTNILGVKGVQKRGNKFRAYITVNYRNISLGTFQTLEQAVEARKAAANEYFGEFTHESERQSETRELD